MREALNPVWQILGLLRDETAASPPCWAHSRRKFHEVEQATGSPIAAEAVRRIAPPYVVGAAIKKIKDLTVCRLGSKHYFPTQSGTELNGRQPGVGQPY